MIARKEGIDSILNTPCLNDFILFFEENGHPKELAEKVYDDFTYNKKWEDKAGFSIKDTWKDIIIKNDFYDKK